MNPTELAEKTCELLEAEFPKIEIYTDDPDNFFDGFYGEVGFPVDPDYFEVWFEEGAVIGLEAKALYSWDSESCDFVAAESDDDEIGFVVLMLHADGNLYEVDQDYGHLNLLFKTPSLEHLVEYLKLFFLAGRDALRARAGQSESLNGLYIPFFQFPDDYEQDYNKMPVVAVDQVKPLIEEHLADGKRWLSAMGDLHEGIREAENKVKEERILPSKFPAFLGEPKEGSMTGWEFAHALISAAQEENEKYRPKLLKYSQQVSADQLIDNWKTLNHLHWDYPTSPLSGDLQPDALSLPLLLEFSDSVFVPALEPSFNPTIYKQLFEAVKLAYWGDPAYRFPIQLDLPDYFEQVHNCFLQTVMVANAPRLAEKAMQLKKTEPRSTPEQQLARRRKQWNALHAVVDKA
jgi:hypothetical protein